MKKYKGEMAHNAGYSDGAKKMAEGHGVGMGMGIGKKASTADIQEFGAMDYIGEQHGNGSMNYEAIKHAKNRKDAGKLRKHAKGYED